MRKLRQRATRAESTSRHEPAQARQVSATPIGYLRRIDTRNLEWREEGCVQSDSSAAMGKDDEFWHTAGCAPEHQGHSQWCLGEAGSRVGDPEGLERWLAADPEPRRPGED